MTASDDRVDAVIEAFLDHLDGSGELPSLDDLDPQERARAEELIASLKAGRGIDPYASRPSLEQLLAGTPLEPALEQAQPTAPSSINLLDEVREQLTLYTPFHVDVWHDTAASGIGVRSDLVALIGAQRLRIQVRDDIVGASELARLDPAAAAGPVYGAFPDTAGVIVVYADEELSSVAIDPFDTEFCIETPGGTNERPTVHRPVLPLADTVRAYLDELAPVLVATIDAGVSFAGEVDATAIAGEAARRAVESVVEDGRRAKIDAKQVSWGALGQREVDALSELIVDALAGLDQPTLAARVAALTGAA